VNAQVLAGSLAPEAGAARLQAGFAKWYKPQQANQQTDRRNK
jgi:raffinose/stachyose/melibiose transport system substrate-binding protein